VTLLLICLAACGSAPGLDSDRDTGSNAQLLAGCGARVARNGHVLLVSPSGGEDTAALQCAIDSAGALGPGAVVQLGDGTFRTGQIVARAFHGTLRGSGSDRTVITNPDRQLFVTPDNWFSLDPSASNPWPALFSFIDGDFTVSDLAIHVSGDAPTTTWSLFGTASSALNYAFVVVGTRANAVFDHLDVRGAPAPGGNGVNLNLALFYSGFAGFPAAPPISGSVEVRASRFGFLSGPATIFLMAEGEVRVIGNSITDVQIGPAVVSAANVGSTILANHIDAQFNGFESFGDVTDSRFLIAGNDIHAHDGIDILSAFSGNVTCSVVGNKTSPDAANGGVGVLLGPGTRNCLIAGSGTVTDRGMNNRVLGP
jgi:hypothetical protein